MNRWKEPKSEYPADGLIYVAPSGLALWLIPFYVGFHPTLIYVAPLGLAFISMNLPLISQKIFG